MSNIPWCYDHEKLLQLQHINPAKFWLILHIYLMRLTLPLINNLVPTFTCTSNYRVTSCNYSYLKLYNYLVQLLLPPTTELLIPPPVITPTSYCRPTLCNYTYLQLHIFRYHFFVCFNFSLTSYQMDSTTHGSSFPTLGSMTFSGHPIHTSSPLRQQNKQHITKKRNTLNVIIANCHTINLM